MAGDRSTSLAEQSTILGDASLLAGDLALVLNSRQSKTPRGSDDWVRQTIEAVKHSISLGMPVLTSVGMNTWELGLWAVAEYGGRAVVICPKQQDIEAECAASQVANDFGLRMDEHAWLFVNGTDRVRGRKTWWDARDRLAFGLATRVFPVSIRSEGHMSDLLGGVSAEMLEKSFAAGYPGSKTLGFPKWESSRVGRFNEWRHLTHWTRRCYGPWPGERARDYYSAVVAGDDRYARDAFATLRRILVERKLRASDEHIRGGAQVVAFTALEPCDAVQLMKWRKRYVRPTFEPYGIAIDQRAALELGIMQVDYVSASEASDSKTPELTQGYGVGDWPAEREWRSVGDVDLSVLSKDDVIVLVPEQEEADELRACTGFRVMPIFDTPGTTFDLSKLRF